MAARPAAQMATLAARKQRLARQETQKRLVKREKVQLKPHQIIGAEFLAARETALLADQMRVGKTLAAVAAADIILAQNICVVTTSSGRAVWRKAFNEGQALPRTVLVNGVDELRGADVIITSWDTAGQFGAKDFDLVIVDESHYAKNPETRRAQSVYGKMYNNGEQMLTGAAVVKPGKRAWCLTGTPAPHDLGDTWSMLRALAPERLKADPAKGWTDVTRYDDFRQRYCIIRYKKLSQWNKIPVVIGGRNEEELRERMQGFILRRTQKDIGLSPPSYGVLPLIPSQLRRARDMASLDQRLILKAAEEGDTKELEMHLGPLRRLTGGLKAQAVIEAVKDEFASGLEKIVLMYYHRDVGDVLQDGLAKFGVARIDGATPPRQREREVSNFTVDENCRVFLGQIDAAGEAIDLSAASVLWFVETVFSPKSMAQAALRITNINQKANCFVKVVTLEGSIDDALQASLMRLWTSINRGIENGN